MWYRFVIGVFMGCLGFGMVAQAQDLTGQVAYVGEDWNVYTYDFADGSTYTLTDDASRTRRYQWVTWSYDGRLAYFCCDVEFARTFISQAFVSPDGITPGSVVYRGVGSAVIYAYWAPQPCTVSTVCLDLALLVNDLFNNTLMIEMVRVLGASSEHRTLAFGSPFYYSWNPNGTQLLFHRNASDIEIYDLASDSLDQSRELTSSGGFQAPAWSPVDDRVAFGVPSSTNARTTDLIIADGTQTQNLLTNVEGLISFVWSPDGRYLAYRVLNNRQFGTLFVLDTQTGDVVRRSSSNGVLAFFWSPDSETIAYLTLATLADTQSAQHNTRSTIQYVQEPSANAFRWSTLNVATGRDRQHNVFVPTSDMIYLVLYFDQFAQSHRLWSPDSRQVVYAEVIGLRQAARSVISLLDVSEANRTPQSLVNGTFAVWSFE